MTTRVLTWLKAEQSERDRRASRWRQGRQRLEAQTPEIRAALLTYWNNHAWLPADASYLLDMLHGFEVERLVMVDGIIRPAQIVIACSEATAAFGPPKPRTQGWFTASASKPRSRASAPKGG